MYTRLAILPMLLPLLLFLTGCEWNVGSIDVKLVYPADPDKDPFDTKLDKDPVSRLRVIITGPGMDPLIDELQYLPGKRGNISAVPVGKQRVVTVEGLSSGGYLKARGVSAPFDMRSGTVKVYVYFAKVRELSPPPAGVAITESEWAERYKTKMTEKRVFHTATLLSDGQLLVAGGVASPAGIDFIGRTEGDALQSMEILDGSAGAFLIHGQSPDCENGVLCMLAERSFHSADLLPNEPRVLLAGGEPSDQDHSAEEYEVSSGTFGVVADMQQPRSRHASVTVPDVGVVIAGGMESISLELSVSLELYRKGFFDEWPDYLSQPRCGAVAVCYPPHDDEPGGVLVIGGWRQWGAPGERLASTRVDKIVFTGDEPYEMVPEENVSFDMQHARADHTAVLLHDGGSPQILVCGGRSDTGTIVGPCELIDPHSEQSVETSFEIPRWRHTSTVLEDGRVMVYGGFKSATAPLQAEPTTVLITPGTFRTETPKKGTGFPRAGHTATLLPNGMVVLVGGVSLLSATSVQLPSTDYEFFSPYIEAPGQ